MSNLLRAIMTVGVVSLGLTAGNVSAATFAVEARTHSSASSAGLDTGLFFKAGDKLLIRSDADDLWSAGPLPRWSNANGLTGDLFATGTDESGQSAGTKIGVDFGLLTQNGFTAPFGALVGEIGSTFFLIGTKFNGPAPDTGNLNLYYWDINSADNSGSIDVTVPEPASLLGLVALSLTTGVAVKRKQISGN